MMPQAEKVRGLLERFIIGMLTSIVLAAWLGVLWRIFALVADIE
jgi:hypothetical protein